MTKDEQRAYSRGYWKGLSRAWPTHYPPSPPTAQVETLFTASQNLNDSVVAVLQVIIPDDDVFINMQRRSMEMDAAFAVITEWLKGQQ